MNIQIIMSYLFPTSSPVTVCPSTMVNAPIPDKHISQSSQRHFTQPEPTTNICVPGSTRFFSISVPVAVALMIQTCAFSNDSWPWSPHSLETHNINTAIKWYNCIASVNDLASSALASIKLTGLYCSFVIIRGDDNFHEHDIKKTTYP